MNEINFEEFLLVEDQNLKSSLTNLGEDKNLFAKIDSIYQRAFWRTIGNNNDEKIINLLYRMIHFELYFCMSCLLRNHISETFASIRKAIDAAFTAYYIILNPNSSINYLKKNGIHKKIFTNIKKHIKQNKNRYPLASDLIKEYEFCSQYGVHSDFCIFFNRVENSKSEILFYYFQNPNDLNEFKKMYLGLISIFWKIFNIFYLEYFSKKFKIIDEQWEKDIINFKEEYEMLKNRLKVNNCYNL